VAILGYLALGFISNRVAVIAAIKVMLLDSDSPAGMKLWPS
jgi:hypothetical protein